MSEPPLFSLVVFIKIIILGYNERQGLELIIKIFETDLGLKLETIVLICLKEWGIHISRF